MSMNITLVEGRDKQYLRAGVSLTFSWGSREGLAHNFAASETTPRGTNLFLTVQLVWLANFTRT